MSTTRRSLTADPKEPNVVERIAVSLRASGDDLGDALREAQLAILRFPRLVQVLVQTLVEEGRRFAATPDGLRWQTRLARSELVRRGQVAWDRSALGMLDQEHGSVVPSMLIDAIIGAILSGDLSAVLTPFAGDEP